MLLRLDSELCQIREASTASEAALLYRWRESEPVPPDRPDLRVDADPRESFSDSELLEALNEYQTDRFLGLVRDQRGRLCGWLELDSRDGDVVETELFGRPLDADRHKRLAMVAATQMLCNHAIRNWNFKAVEARCAGEDRLRFEMLVMTGFQTGWQTTTDGSLGANLRYLRYTDGLDSAFNPCNQSTEDGAVVSVSASLPDPSLPAGRLANPGDFVFVGARSRLSKTIASEIPYLACPPCNPGFHREIGFDSPKHLEDSLNSKLKESELPVPDRPQVLTVWQPQSDEIMGWCFFQWMGPGIGSIHGGLFDRSRRRSGAGAEGLVAAMGYFFDELRPDLLVNLVQARNHTMLSLLMGLGWYGVGSYHDSNIGLFLVFEFQRQDFDEHKTIRYLLS